MDFYEALESVAPKQPEQKIDVILREVPDAVHEQILASLQNPDVPSRRIGQALRLLHSKKAIRLSISDASVQEYRKQHSWTK